MSISVAEGLRQGELEDLVPAPSRAELFEIVKGAASAPSGDNCQPWRVRLTSHGFDLWFIADRARSLLDAGHTASRIACGAFLEAARLRALELGWVAKTVVSSTFAPSAPWARMTLVRLTDPQAFDPLATQLMQRQTNRRRFDGSPLSARELSCLAAAAMSSARVELVNDRPAIDRLARLSQIAEQCRAESQAAHEEMHRWLRWSDTHAAATGDGLDVRTLALSAWEKQLVRFLAPWSRMKLAIGLGAGRANGAYARRLVQSASSIGAIVVSGNTTAAEVTAGRVLERVWLTAASLGLAFSPVAALPLLLLRVANPGDSPLAPRHARVLQHHMPELNALCRVGEGERLLFLFRVGRAAPVPVRALRRDVNDLIDLDAGDDQVLS